ncbi:MAG: sulfurtransferase [Rhodospirillaceae bacterium]|nr:sulfurtransferase [Rhodospirillaceae bacterium]|tara:strand:- start:618 stop:1583 length:966 start_codon:yes stop_codon:yes gene_type:complete
MFKLRYISIILFFFIFTNASLASSPLVSSDWLSNRLNDTNIKILDIRNKIDNGGLEVFLKGHIPGSIHSDYLKDGWRVKRNNVVGLLPLEKQYKDIVESIGLKNSDHVIIVPAGVSSTDFGSAARVYWTLKIYGHENLSILDGGYADWESKFPNLIQTSDYSKPIKSNYITNYNPSYYISTEEVLEQINQGKSLLIDARTQIQWRGKEKHPASLKAGRLPRGVLMSQEENYDRNTNRLKEIKDLKNLYKNIKNTSIVSYCNTGHWAATNWFVLSELLGKKNVKLYDGSMVEWTNDPNLPVVTEIKKIDDIKYWIKSVISKI